MLWVDRFGNAQLNVDPDELERPRRAVRVRHSASGRRAAGGCRPSPTAAPGELGLVIDSYGLVAVVLDRRSAAEELGLGAGDAVRLEPSADDGADAVRGTVGVSPGRLPARPSEPHDAR